jgi:predicted phosphodiesterase
VDKRYLKRIEETDFDYKARLLKYKLEYKEDIDWSEIANLLKIKCSSDHLRKTSYGFLEAYNHSFKDDKYIKVLIMNDLHLPYQRDDVLEQIEKYKNVDYLIFAGDLVDCESCTHFPNFKHPDVNEELIIAYNFINKINNIIDKNKTKIITILGNHENRFKKSIMNMQEKQLQKMLNPNLLSMLEKGFTIYEDDKEIIYKPIENFKYINKWYAKLFNNLIVAHPTDFSSIDGKMAEKVSEHFLNKRIADRDDIIIFAHTHKHSSMYVNRRQGIYVIENFCLCKEQEYADTGKLKYTPQNYGYTYLKFKKGKKININDIKLNFLK